MDDTTHFVKIIDKTLNLLNEKAQDLPTLIYDFQDKISRIWLAHIDSAGATGWASAVLGEDGVPFFNPDEAKIIEEKFPNFLQSGGAFPKMPGLSALPALPSLSSGMPAMPAGMPALPAMPAGMPALPAGMPALPAGMPALPAMPAGMPAMPAGMPAGMPAMPAGMSAMPAGMPALPASLSSINPNDISIDKAYEYLITYLDKLDDQNRTFSKKLGILKYVNELPDPQITIPATPIPTPPITVFAPSRSVPYMIASLLEMIRLIVSFGILKSDNIRKLMSVVIASFDVLRGEWKHGVLSLLGLWSPGGVVAGIVLKLVRDAWLLINPRVRVDLRDDMYRSTKSFFVGFWLWVFATFMPGLLRTRANDLIQKFADEAAKFVPSLKGKQFTLDNIQEIQSLLSNPAFSCSKDIQKVLDPLFIFPPFRLSFELMGLPTTPYFRKHICRGMENMPLEQIIAETVTGLPIPDEMLGHTGSTGSPTGSPTGSTASPTDGPTGSPTGSPAGPTGSPSPTAGPTGSTQPQPLLPPAHEQTQDTLAESPKSIQPSIPLGAIGDSTRSSSV